MRESGSWCCSLLVLHHRLRRKLDWNGAIVNVISNSWASSATTNYKLYAASNTTLESN